jgi:hypothetical protein
VPNPFGFPEPDQTDIWGRKKILPVPAEAALPQVVDSIRSPLPPESAPYQANPYGDPNAYKAALAQMPVPRMPLPAPQPATSAAAAGLGTQIPTTPSFQSLPFNQQMVAPIPQGLPNAGQSLQAMYADANKTGNFKDIEDFFKKMPAQNSLAKDLSPTMAADALKKMQAPPQPSSVSSGMPGLVDFGPDHLTTSFGSSRPFSRMIGNQADELTQRAEAQRWAEMPGHQASMANAAGASRAQLAIEQMKQAGEPEKMAQAAGLTREGLANELKKTELHNQGQLAVAQAQHAGDEKKLQTQREHDNRTKAAMNALQTKHAMEQENLKAPGTYTPKQIQDRHDSVLETTMKSLNAAEGQVGDSVKAQSKPGVTPSTEKGPAQHIDEINQAVASMYPATVAKEGEQPQKKFSADKALEYLKTMPSNPAERTQRYKELFDSMKDQPGGLEPVMQAIAEQTAKSGVLHSGSDTFHFGAGHPNLQYDPSTGVGRSRAKATGRSADTSGPLGVQRTLTLPSGKPFKVEDVLPGAAGRGLGFAGAQLSGPSSKDKEQHGKNYDVYADALEAMDRYMRGQLK